MPHMQPSSHEHTNVPLVVEKIIPRSISFHRTLGTDGTAMPAYKYGECICDAVICGCFDEANVQSCIPTVVHDRSLTVDHD